MKIASALVVCLKGPELLKEEESFLKREKPAGLILFKRNIQSAKQAAGLIKRVKSLIKPPFFVSLDCEGGAVNRLSHLSEKTLWPSPEEMSFFSPQKIFSTARQMASYLKLLGFDINFAPLVDIPIVSSPLLKTRIFGDSALVVERKAGAFMKGLLSKGILPCLKHFPGHGGVEQDSHETLPQDFRTLEELKPQIDLFEELLNKYTSAVMTAHVEFPKIEKIPATFSKKILTQILKTKRAFKGLVFSDDIDMKALKKFSPGESFFLALQAGCDLVLACQKEQTPYKIIDYFERKPLKKKQLEKKLQMTKRKILRLRTSHSLFL